MRKGSLVSEIIYVLVALDSDYEGCSTSLLFADLSPDKLEKIKALAESISEKHKSAEKITHEHMQQWEKQKGNKRPDWQMPEAKYKTPRNREKRKIFEQEHAVEVAEYDAQVGAFQLVHKTYNERWVAERDLIFHSNLNLTDEEAVLYPTVEIHAGSSFEIEEVLTP